MSRPSFDELLERSKSDKKTDTKKRKKSFDELLEQSAVDTKPVKKSDIKPTTTTKQTTSRAGIETKSNVPVSSKAPYAKTPAPTAEQATADLLNKPYSERYTANDRLAD